MFGRHRRVRLGVLFLSATFVLGACAAPWLSDDSDRIEEQRHQEILRDWGTIESEIVGDSPGFPVLPGDVFFLAITYGHDPEGVPFYAFVVSQPRIPGSYDSFHVCYSTDEMAALFACSGWLPEYEEDEYLDATPPPSWQKGEWWVALNGLGDRVDEWSSFELSYDPSYVREAIDRTWGEDWP